MKPGTTLKSIPVLGAALLFSACSSSSSSAPDVTAPTVMSATQNRTADPLGFTVDIRMNEALTAASANVLTNWTSTLGNITNVVLQPDLVTVRLTMDIVAIPGALTFGTIAGLPATGTVDLTAQVTDGDTVTVSDGTTSVTFEFTSGGGATAGNIEVDKGASATDAIANFITAFNAQSFNITAAAGAGDSADLTNDFPGMDGNVAITETDAGGVITLLGMVGGTGVQDLFGNVIDTAINGIVLDSTDLLAPNAATVSGVTVPGFDNDLIEVLFDDNMIESEVEALGNWTVEAPVGTVFDLTGATIDYDPMTRIASIMLDAGIPGVVATNGNNLQTFDSIAASFTTMRDVSGNTITATTIGVDATQGMSMGDDQPPTFTGVTADGVANTLDVHFSEPVRTVAFGDLYAGGLDPGPRFLLTDQDGVAAVAATGMITFGGDPADGETFTINDGVNTETFEFESAGGVAGGNIAINISAGDNNMMAADTQAAIAGSTLTITAANVLADCNLTHNTPGAAGNIAITGTPTNVTISGMAGGSDSAPANAPAVAIAFPADGLSANVDYSPSVPADGADMIELYGVRDLAGNQAFAAPAQPVVSVNAAEPAIDAGNTTVSAISNRNNDIIDIRFDRAMNPFHLLNPANYSVPGIDLSNALISQATPDQVLITLNGGDDQNFTFGNNYNVTLVSNAMTPLMSALGTPLTVNDVEIIAATGDNSPPTAAGTLAYVGSAAEPNTCIIVFTEAVDPVAAMVTTNYAISAVNPTQIDLLNARTFRLTFPTQPTAGQQLDVETAAATDLAGNPAAAQMNLALLGADFTAPTAIVTATTVENVGGDTINITFSEAVDLTTALDPANYFLFQNGLPISTDGATFGYNAGNTRVRIRLSDNVDLTNGFPFSVFLSNIRDLSGNFLLQQPGIVTVGGDVVDPTLDEAFTNLIVDGTGMTVDALFSEDIDEAFANNIGNWSTDGPAIIQSANRIAPDIVRFTFDQPLGANEMLQVNFLRDLAGNNGGGLQAVDPAE